jgi:hypothetical protein
MRARIFDGIGRRSDPLLHGSMGVSPVSGTGLATTGKMISKRARRPVLSLRSPVDIISAWRLIFHKLLKLKKSGKKIAHADGLSIINNPSAPEGLQPAMFFTGGGNH